MHEPRPGGDPLRITDIVPLRRMLGTDSLVIRVNPDGTFAPFEHMPSLFFDRAIREVLSDARRAEFETACRRAIDLRRSVVLPPSASVNSHEIMINPVLDDDGDECRFLVCWLRQVDVVAGHAPALGWTDLSLDQVVVRYRWVGQSPGLCAVEAAPWWMSGDGELLELSPQHTRVSAIGLGHALMQSLIFDAIGEAAASPDGPALRIEIPSADMLAGLVPVFHAAVRSTGIDAGRVIAVIPVDLAADPDLLPIIVHLYTIGLRIDLRGLDALASTLYTITRQPSAPHGVRPLELHETGPWVESFAEAVRVSV